MLFSSLFNAAVSLCAFDPDFDDGDCFELVDDGTLYLLELLMLGALYLMAVL